ncbi:MAG: DUF6361 family protein [Bacillota bacterium]
MGSTFTWLDFSEQQRRQALDVLDLFREQDTRDELGIGTVRDALADLLFPGTSTIQTRARYFLFVPWLYLDLERRRVRSDKIAERARAEEVRLIAGLDRSADRNGIIGVQARSGLKRLPSNVYWQGLRRWGIRIYPGSQDQYHRSIDGYYRAVDHSEQDDEPPLSNWHMGIPQPPPAFPQEASFQLTEEEAAYLHDRIMVSCRGSLLAYLVDHPEGDDMDAPFPWEHRLAATLPTRLSRPLTHARNFSELMHGAALLYNLMLAQLDRPDLIDPFVERLQGWHAQIRRRAAELSTWDRPRFWELVRSEGARIPIQTQTFVEFWVERVIGGLKTDEPLADLLTDGRVHAYMEGRETALKGSQARLTNKHARELWQGQSGTAQLAFRWPTARSFIADIRAGLNGGGADA